MMGFRKLNKWSLCMTQSFSQCVSSFSIVKVEETFKDTWVPKIEQYKILFQQARPQQFKQVLPACSNSPLASCASPQSLPGLFMARIILWHCLEAMVLKRLAAHAPNFDVVWFHRANRQPLGLFSRASAHSGIPCKCQKHIRTLSKLGSKF